MIDKKQVENVKCFNCFGTVINAAICTREIKFRVAMPKAVLSRKKTLFTVNLDVNLRKKLENFLF